MDTADTGFTLVREVAGSMLGQVIDGVEQVGGGRNSRVFRVRCGHDNFALKQYPASRDDPRDRLGTEVETLRVMERQGFAEVPRVIATDGSRGFAAFTWIAGTPVQTVHDDDIDQACGFLARVHALRRLPALPPDRLASEACLSGAEIERQIAARLGTLEASAGSAPELQAFLDRHFVPALDRLLVRAKERMRDAGLDFDAPLAQGRRSLVPSDFGFHNSIRRPDASLAFIDFEYFGWDDPVKLTADVLFHPGMVLDDRLRARFRAHAERSFGEDENFRTRLDAYLPLFGLRWALIVLNEFLPHRWRLRQLAGTIEDWDKVKQRQLALAHTLVARAELAREESQWP